MIDERTIANAASRYINPAHHRYWRVFRQLRKPITVTGGTVICYIAFSICINNNEDVAVNWAIDPNSWRVSSFSMLYLWHYLAHEASRLQRCILYYLVARIIKLILPFHIRIDTYNYFSGTTQSTMS